MFKHYTYKIRLGFVIFHVQSASQTLIFTYLVVQPMVGILDFEERGAALAHAVRLLQRNIPAPLQRLRCRGFCGRRHFVDRRGLWCDLVQFWFRRFNRRRRVSRVKAQLEVVGEFWEVPAVEIVRPRVRVLFHERVTAFVGRFTNVPVW